MKSPYDLYIALGRNFYHEIHRSESKDQVQEFHTNLAYPPELLKHSIENSRSQHAIVHTPFTLLPINAYDESHISDIIREVFVYEEVSEYDGVQIDEVQCLYVIDSALKNIIVQHFSGFKIHHVLETLLRLHYDSHRLVHAHWFDDTLTIVAWNEGLKMAQHYYISSPEDALYYVLATYQHAGLDHHIDPLYFSGDCSPGGRYYAMLDDYVKILKPYNTRYSLPMHNPIDAHQVLDYKN